MEPSITLLKPGALIDQVSFWRLAFPTRAPPSRALGVRLNNNNSSSGASVHIILQFTLGHGLKSSCSIEAICQAKPCTVHKCHKDVCAARNWRQGPYASPIFAHQSVFVAIFRPNNVRAGRSVWPVEKRSKLWVSHGNAVGEKKLRTRTSAICVQKGPEKEEELRRRSR